MATELDAYQLMHEGTIALAQLEANGIRIDVDYLNRTRIEVKESIKTLKKALQSHEVYRLQLKRFGAKTNLTSRPQLAKVLTLDMGIKLSYTEASKEDKGNERHKMDNTALEALNLDYCKDFLQLEKLNKLSGTYLEGVAREVTDGILHVGFNLHLATTWRSCVAKGTLIEVVRDLSKQPKGTPIEDVKAGDLAYCYDDNLDLVVRKVLWAGKTGNRKVVRVHWQANRGRTGFTDVTPEHLIRTITGEYVQAQNLLNSDLRKNKANKHTPKSRVLAMRRSLRQPDCVYQTGRSRLLDHRIVYQSVYGDLSDEYLVHHKDENHYNNNPSNLQKMTSSEHATHHCSFTDDDRRAGVKQRLENHKLSGNSWPSGEGSPSWINLSKYQMLRMLAENSGRSARVPMDFATFKRKALLFNIDLKAVKDRYDAEGSYISKGRIATVYNGSLASVACSFKINREKAVRLLKQRGIDNAYVGPCRNPTGRKGYVNNHIITKLEYLEDAVDVYDIEVEQHHNFIANEICVHNSSSDPNFQNIPIRNPEVAKLIRSAFIPRDDHVLVEIDYAALEFRIASCFWRDPSMVDYASNPMKDIHRDCAAEIFKTKPSEVSKNARYCAKNQFVFPELYGDFYMPCAKANWESIDTFDLKVGDVPMRDHLKKHGITKLGLCSTEERPVPNTFEWHLKNVEKTFYEWFPVLKERRDEFWKQYLKTGQFELMTGFVVKGVCKRNFVLNAIIQGPAFHLLLWSVIQLVKWTQKNKTRTKIVGQIHDSVIADVHVNELDDYLQTAKDIMTIQTKKRFSWVITPLDVEAEVAETNWYDKKAIAI